MAKLREIWSACNYNIQGPGNKNFNNKDGYRFSGCFGNIEVGFWRKIYSYITIWKCIGGNISVRKYIFLQSLTPGWSPTAYLGPMCTRWRSQAKARDFPVDGEYDLHLNSKFLPLISSYFHSEQRQCHVSFSILWQLFISTAKRCSYNHPTQRSQPNPTYSSRAEKGN